MAKMADLRLKTDHELETRRLELKKEQVNLRFQRATNQLANTARVGAVRREVAQIETILGERKRASAA